MAKIKSVMKVGRMHQHVKFHAILLMHSSENVRKPQFDLFQQVKIDYDHGLLIFLTCIHNLLSSEGDQDTSACQIAGHSSHAFPRICPESQNAAKMRKSTNRDQNPISSECGQISDQFYPAFFSKGSETTSLICFTWSDATKIRKVNRPWSHCTQFWRWSEYISI